MGTSDKKSTLIAVVAFGLLILCMVAVKFFAGGGRKSSNWDQLRKEAKEAIRQADAQWDSGNKPEAIVAYKQILRDHSEALRFAFVRDSSTAPRLFRRVIEYELKYGDKGEARDYMNEATTDYHLRRTLTMDTPEGKQLLHDVLGRLTMSRKLD